ncbi:hypothetical protein [Nocardia carnea]|uniref:hypothetical protein n=1 Tax=Nocardia carnea TaxID=37328 RepID=UPI00245623F4|nr:hypothetical protein [Nocardia carnea]
MEKMPGVYQVFDTYSNDFTAGTFVSLGVKMQKDASTAHAEAVALRIAHSFRTDFSRHSRDMRLLTADWTFEHHTSKRNEENLSPESITADLRTLWQIRAAMPTPRHVSWKRVSSSAVLRVGDATDAAVLHAVRSVLGDRAVRVFATIRGAPTFRLTGLPPADSPSGLRARTAATHWQIDFPFGPTDEARARSTVERSPLKVGKVTVSGGYINEIQVYAAHSTQVHADLSAFIESSAVTPAHPFFLRWNDSSRPDPDLFFAGSVHVAGCDYADNLGEQSPELYFTPEAITLQKQLRSEYDNCPK